MTHFSQLINSLGISSSAGFPRFISSLGNECLSDHVALCVNRRSEFVLISLSLICTFYLQSMIKWEWKVFPSGSYKRNWLELSSKTNYRKKGMFIFVKHKTANTLTCTVQSIQLTINETTRTANWLMDFCVDFVSRPVSRLYCFVCAFTSLSLWCVSPRKWSQ